MNPIYSSPYAHTVSDSSEERKLAGKLRKETAEIHQIANTHPFAQSIINGCVSISGYTQHLIDLFNVFRSLEESIWNNASSNRIGPLLIPEVFRAEKLSQDIAVLEGDREQPLTAAKNYVAHLHTIAQTKPHGLIGHAYTNYLGLFFGGRQFSDSVAQQFGDNAVSYYNFDELCQTNQLKSPMSYVRTFREILSSLPLTDNEEREVLEEANTAFGFWIEMFNGVQAPLL
ncbi:MAG: heme oxygenase (biliverdin-producing) [Parachlamydiaceae bacterium]